MGKKRNSGFGISRSTKITLVSCLCFIALTCLILVFFVMFPITPSEKIIASIGRENAVSIENTAPASTEATVRTKSIASSTVKSGTTTAKTVKIVITTGSGFLWNGRVPSGISAGSDYPTTAVDPDIPTYDPGYVPPVIPNTGVIVPNGGTWADPNVGGTWTDPNAGGNWADPNTGGTWIDPNTGGGVAADPNTGGGVAVDPNAGGGTAVDPNAGGGAAVDPNAGGGAAVDPNAGGGAAADPNAGGGAAVDPNVGGNGNVSSGVDEPPVDVSVSVW